MSDTVIARDIAESEFTAAVVDASRHRGVVVDFWAPWCGPCHQLSPIIERVAARHVDDVDLVKVNVDEAPALARQYRIQGIPAVKAFRDGAVVAELTGVQPEATYEQLFAGLAPSEADRLATRADTETGPERERLLRAALDADPGHARSIAALARLDIDRGATDEARSLLARAPADPQVRRLLAELDLADTSDDVDEDELAARVADGDPQAALALGRRRAAQGTHEEALDALLRAVRDPATRDEARAAILRIFELLGDDHELVRRARPKLAAALF
jgi:putative thioredoxin